MSDYVSSVMQALHEAYPRALGYAERKTRKFRAGPLASRMNPISITHTIVIKTLDGKRPWNQEKIPDLYVHLAGGIKSEINNILNKRDSKGKSINDLLHTMMDIDSPDKELEREETEIILRKRIKCILEYISSEREDLIKIADIMYNMDIREPRIIAKKLGMSARDVGIKKIAIKRILNRSKFIITYVSAHQEELADIAIAIYREKITKARELSDRCGIDIEKARLMREELSGLPEKVYKGKIY